MCLVLKKISCVEGWSYKVNSLSFLICKDILPTFICVNCVEYFLGATLWSWEIRPIDKFLHSSVTLDSVRKDLEIS